MNTIKFCAKCGAPIGPEEKFCGGCGASIAEMEAEAGISTQQAAPAQAPVQQAQPVQQQAPQYDKQYAQPANNYAQAAAPAAAKPNPFAKGSQEDNTYRRCSSYRCYRCDHHSVQHS